ncbi:leucine rich repeat domain-containing protein [Ditylenchus destructor]|uniref:Leucine rich repeat domain-containing protein n=1 Tax=Ditylenchus destructor TaxID=166010 RepID=A0AAD4MNH0_9BILA|nr:leucine rich repeat domain-containing protein [Ditylenchus destructor]
MKAGLVVLTLIHIFLLSQPGEPYKVLGNCPDLPTGCYCSKYDIYSYSISYSTSRSGVYVSCKITNDLPLCDVLESLKEHDNALKNSCSKCRNKRSLSIQKLSLDFCPSYNFYYYSKRPSSYDFDDETIDAFPKLKIRTLEIKACGKMGITDDAFESLTDTLTSLTVQNLQLTRVPKSVGNLTHLTTLNLDQNNITKVEFLDKLSNLQSLSLSRNQISEIDENVFEPLKNLTYLKVAHNRLKTLPSLRFLPELETLYAYDNQIEKVNSFMGLLKLKEVRLDSNKISELPPYMFTANPLLKEIYLSYNKISKVDDTVFGLLPNVTKLSLKYNQLSKVGNIFRNFPNITTIGLMANNFTTLKGSNFANLETETYVDLDANNLTHISPEDFDGSFISTLDLRNNHYLDPQKSMSFYNTSKIEQIHLGYCLSSYGLRTAYPRSEPPPKPVTTTLATTTMATTATEAATIPVTVIFVDKEITIGR